MIHAAAMAAKATPQTVQITFVCLGSSGQSRHGHSLANSVSSIVSMKIGSNTAFSLLNIPSDPPPIRPTAISSMPPGRPATNRRRPSM